LRAEITEVLKQPDVRDRLLKSGSGETYFTTPEEFAARIKKDNETFGKVINTLGIKIE
jgi:tripartite-type tricarboxylate transporter receptor subunit TctC